MLAVVKNIAPINNKTKSKINMGMTSSMLVLVVFDGLYYPCDRRCGEPSPRAPG